MDRSTGRRRARPRELARPRSAGPRESVRPRVDGEQEPGRRRGDGPRDSVRPRVDGEQEPGRRRGDRPRVSVRPRVDGEQEPRRRRVDGEQEPVRRQGDGPRESVRPQVDGEQEPARRRGDGQRESARIRNQVRQSAGPSSNPRPSTPRGQGQSSVDMERSTRQTRTGPSVAAAVARQQAPQRMEVVVAPVAPQQQDLLKDSPIERSKLSLARGLRIWATPPLDERIFRRPQRQQIRVPLNDMRLNDTPHDLLIRKLFCELIQRRLGGLINFNQIVAMEQKGYQLVFPQASHNTALVVPENVRIEGIMQRIIDSDNSGYDLGQPASTHILESIHCTLIMFRGRYVLIFLDDFSQYVTVYTPNMRNDHYVYDSLEKFYLKISECMVLPQDDEIQIVRHSIGTMFMHDFPSQFDVENWHDYFSAKEYPLKIERAIGPSRVSAVGQMLTESAEQMLTDAGLNRSIFTEYAVEYAAYCLNHILNPITGTTPIERWTYWPDQPNLPQPTLHHLAVFGCHAKRTEKELVDAVFLGCTEPNCGPYGYDVQNYCYSERNGFQSFVTWCMRFSENHYVFNPRSPAHMQVN